MYLRVFSVFILLASIGCSKQDKAVEMELSDNYGEIQSIHAYASCEGPGGSYRTMVKSMQDGSCEFLQQFSYRDAPFHGYINDKSEGFVLDTLGNPTDTLSKEAIVMLRSHEFHKIHTEPESAFSTIEYKDQKGDSVFFQAKDQLGNPVRITYNKNRDWIEKFEMRNPVDTTELIEVRFTYMEDSSYGPLASELLIIQGGKDVFTFSFDSVLVNNELVTF